MTDKIVSSVVVVAAIIAAAIIDSSGGDASPYLSIATLALGYGVGHTVQKARKKK